jgi:hypothetical protein
MFCLLVKCLFSCFLIIFKKVVETLPKDPFTVCQRAVDSFLKCFTWVMNTLLKEFARSLHQWFDFPLAFASPLEQVKFWVKKTGQLKKYKFPAAPPQLHIHTETRCSKISKEMSLLYFGLDVFCQFEARIPEFDGEFSVQYSDTLYRGEGCVSNCGTPASNRHNAASPKYNDDSSCWSHNTSSLDPDLHTTYSLSQSRETKKYGSV